MKLIKKLILIWFFTLLLMACGLLFFPHLSKNSSFLINWSIQVLLFYISILIFLKEPTKKHKFLFLNFSIAFSIVFLNYLYLFVGFSIFTDNPYNKVYAFQYINALLVLLQAFAIIYLVFDLLFRDYKIYQKYILTTIVVGIVFVYYFHPFLNNPKYIYKTENIQKYKILSEAKTSFIENYSKEPNSYELAQIVMLPAIQEGQVIGQLYPEENLKQISEMLPYLEGDNWTVLIWQPLYFRMIYMNVFILLFILLYFGYQYAKDPPQGAYIDKIMFMFLLVFALDVFHYWANIKNVEYNLFMDLFNIGQYFTTAALFGLAMFFFARLRFITSVVGEFYETELQANPEKISRWLDGIDRFILKHFGNSKEYKSRLFEQRVN